LDEKQKGVRKMAEKKDVRVRDMDSRAWREIKAYAARHDITVAAALTRAIWLLTGGFASEKDEEKMVSEDN
jgi:hypothetical protein